MKNLGAMMKKAQEMQQRMGELQEELGAFEAEGVSAAGNVRVRLNGKFEMRGLTLIPALVDPDDVEVLEDLIQAAYNDAKTKIDAFKAQKVSELTGGLPLPPGMQLPF